MGGLPGELQKIAFEAPQVGFSQTVQGCHRAVLEKIRHVRECSVAGGFGQLWKFTSERVSSDRMRPPIPMLFISELNWIAKPIA